MHATKLTVKMVDAPSSGAQFSVMQASADPRDSMVTLKNVSMAPNLEENKEPTRV